MAARHRPVYRGRKRIKKHEVFPHTYLGFGIYSSVENGNGNGNGTSVVIGNGNGTSVVMETDGRPQEQQPVPWQEKGNVIGSST